jgi:DNA-binding CsgD family transcriptional regulator
MAADPIGPGPSAASALTTVAGSGMGTLPRTGADLNRGRCAISRTQLAVSGARSTPEVAVAGSLVARRLVREVVTEPDGLRRVDVIGPGGHGKTVLLDALAAAFRTAGVEVRRDLPDPGVELGEVALLVDDAHLRAPAELEQLVRLAAGPLGYLVVAHRPWPRPTGTAALGAALAARRPPVVLDALDRAGVASRVTLRLGEPAGAAGSALTQLVEMVLERTAGLPVLVDRLLDALAEQIGSDRARLPMPDRSPPGLLAQLGYTVAAQDPGVRGLLLASALGAPVEAEVLVPLLGLTGGPAALDELLEAARAAGLLTSDGLAVPLISDAVLARTPAGTRSELQRALAEIELGRGGNIRTVARGLLDAGMSGARAAAVFSAAAAEVLPDGGPEAGDFLDAAVRAGTPAIELAARRAEAAVLADDLDVALTRADQVLAAPDRVPADDLVRAGTAAAAVLARRGMLARSAELHRWMGMVTGRASAIAVPALIGTGALDEAREVLRGSIPVTGAPSAAAPSAPTPSAAAPGAAAPSAAAPSAAAPSAAPSAVAPNATTPSVTTPSVTAPSAATPSAATPGVATPLPIRPPTLLAGAEELMAKGVYDSVAGSPTAALSELTRAAALLETSYRAALLPDTPAALAALVAVHCGEHDVAQSVLERAVRMRLGGPGAATRHRLLLGWIALSRGAIPAARSALQAASPQGVPLEPRDELLAAALEVALARRTGDLASLMPAWGRAREAIVRHPVDLFVLHQLGELSIAATRLRESSWVRPHLDEAAQLLGRLGDPALWAAPLHWSALQAAIITESRDAAQLHAVALETAADGSRYAAAMAAAAPHWVRILDNEVDPIGVEAAARGLHAVGMSWEGGKLAGQAAIRTRDRKAMSALLGCARALQAGSGPAAKPAPESESDAGPTGIQPVPAPTVDLDDPDEGDGPLSGREREVAALVLEGLTYKQIGEQLFISAKTVEHHVARMRQRLGSGSRGELFAHLRQIVGGPNDG